MIRVYLDSSDFSVMADPRRDREVAKTREFLEAKISSGVIEVRFSALHVLEAAHTTASAKNLAVARAELIQALSARKCLTWHFDIITEEAHRIAKGVPLTPTEYAIRNDGRWFPGLEEFTIDVHDFLAKGLEQAFSGLPLSRQQKRQLQRHLFRNGRLTPQAVALLQPGRRELLEQMRAQFPLPDRFFDEDILLKVATGSAPPELLVGALVEALSDLKFFVGWAFDRHDPEQKLTRWLRGGALMTSVKAAREKFNELRELVQKFQLSEREYNQMIRPHLEKMRTSVRDYVLWSIYDTHKVSLFSDSISKDRWQERVILSEWGSIPSLDNLVNCARSLFHKKCYVAEFKKAKEK